MHLFYAPELDCSRDYSLSREEAQHCVRVLRMKEGDRVLLTDGKGGLYQAEIVQAVAQTYVCRVEKQLEDTQKRDYHIHIALAPTKNNARTEWFVEKAVEMGIDEVSLFESRYSERTNVKTERLEKVVISALKQSFKANITTINPIVDFKTLVDGAKEQYKFIATCEGDQRAKLKDCYRQGGDVIVLIGPEGDFSENEVAYAEERGFRPITLGEARLRTETAALYALQGIHFINF